VGVNRYQTREQEPVATLRIDQAAEARQIDKLRALRKTRDNEDVEHRLDQLRRAASSATREGGPNLMPPLLDAVRAYATLGEICDALREVFGTYEERPTI
jgi:methylmalonyl-CoA mutase N-terminal domain/subunit